MSANCLTRRMLLVLVAICTFATLATAQLPSGYLAPPGQLDEDKVLGAKTPYRPQPGDLVFFTNDSLFFDMLYALAWTGAPHHVGIVVALPDGKPAIAEAGAFHLSSVKLIDLPAHLRTFPGHVHIRRLLKPLSPEQAHKLNRYALEQTCKPYAHIRVVVDSMILRSHGVIGSRLFGCSSLDRSSWTCYELVVACAASGGLLDPTEVKPNTVFVRDLFRDEPEIFGTIWHAPAIWSPGPEAPR